MNYYYDILLNWNEKSAYEFYEWNDTDYLEYIRKIPLVKIKHKAFLDFSTKQVRVNEEFLKGIADRTIINTKSIVNKIHYACLFTDNKNVLAIEFNDEGVSINRSKLSLDDELNILEVSFTLKDTDIEYTCLNEIEKSFELRQVSEAKKFILLELDNLYQAKNKEKLKYLYYELKKETEEDLNLIYENLKEEVNSHFDQNILKLYYIIKLSYHNV